MCSQDTERIAHIVRANKPYSWCLFSRCLYLADNSCESNTFQVLPIFHLKIRILLSTFHVEHSAIKAFQNVVIPVSCNEHCARGDTWGLQMLFYWNSSEFIDQMDCRTVRSVYFGNCVRLLTTYLFLRGERILAPQALGPEGTIC